MALIHVAALNFAHSKTCFLIVPEKWIKKNFPFQVVSVFKLQYGKNRKAYFSCKEDFSPSNSDEIRLNGKYALTLGLRDKEQVLISQVTSSITDAQKVCLEPLSSDDWEIMNLNSQFVETNLLHQIRIIWKGQVFPIYAHQSSFFVKVVDIVPEAEPALLVEWTEIHVAPKERGSAKGTATKLKGKHKKKDIYSQYNHLRKNTSKVKKSSFTTPSSSASGYSHHTTHSDHSVSDLHEPSSNKLEVFSLFRFVMKSVFTSDYHDQVDAKDQSLSNDFYPLHFDFRLRVISYSRGFSEKCTLPLAIQATTVFITSQTFQAHCGSSTVPDCFVASLSKLLSPTERKEQVQMLLSKAASGKSKLEKEKKDIDKEFCFDSVCVNVVVLKRVEEEYNVPEALFLSSDYISVPLELKRRLGLEISSCIQCRSMDYQPFPFNSILLYPLANLHVSFSDSSVNEAFVKWVDDANLEESSLVLCDGTLVKLAIANGKTCDFIVRLSESETMDTSSPYSSPLSVSSASLASSESDKTSLFSEALKPNYGFVSDIKLKRIAVKLGAYSPRLRKSVWCYSLPSNKVENLYHTVPALSLSALGGIQEISEKGSTDFEIAFSLRPISPVSSYASLRCRCMLVHGPKGVGKTTLVDAFCKKLINHPHFIFTHTVKCLPLRGKRVETISKKWEGAVSDAIHRQPSVLVFDDLDQLACAPASPEQEAGSDGLYFTSIVQVFLNLVKKLVVNRDNVVIIATSRSIHSLHPTLTKTKGCHAFQSVLEMKPPNVAQRSEILQSLILSKLHLSSESIPSVSWTTIATKTEGYVAQDLNILVDKATHAAWIRTKCSSSEDQDAMELILTDNDFEVALNGYTPSSLRSLQLHEGSNRTWRDVGGLHEVKEVIHQILTWPTKYEELFKTCFLKPQRNILLYGEPGTGKTLIASTVASQCDLNFISIKGPELLSKYIGASEQAVRDLFLRATSAKPCILFFDEFDALAPRRGHDSTGVTDRVVNQLLTQLDGVENMEGVYVLAATSRPELIDPALLRPGRLDKCLHCPLPDKNDRLEILEALSSKLSLSDDVDFEAIVSKTEHFSGADLQALLYSAQLGALHDSISKKARKYSTGSSDIDFEELSERVMIMPTVAEGEIDPLSEDAKEIMQSVGHILSHNYGLSISQRSRRHRRHSMLSITIEQKHLLKVLPETKPSVSLKERLRYKLIFEKFTTNRGTDFVASATTDAKKVTLA